jgi:hypothetical protein
MGDRGFIMTEEERLKLVRWAYSMIKDMRELPYGRSDYFLYPNDTKIDELVWKVKKRIVDREGLRLSKPESMFGDFLGIIHKNGKIHKHKDRNEEGLIHSRFNVILQHSGSGNTYYDGKPLLVKEGSYVLCRSGLDYHWTDENESSRERISLSFGYFLPESFVNRLNDKFPL